MPEMTHPDSKLTVNVAKEQVEVYQSQGWETKADKK